MGVTVDGLPVGFAVPYLSGLARKLLMQPRDFFIRIAMLAVFLPSIDSAKISSFSGSVKVDPRAIISRQYD